MHLMYFTEQPMSAYDEKAGLDYGATALTFSNKHFDPKEGARLYNEYLDQYMLCEEVGIQPVLIGAAAIGEDVERLLIVTTRTEAHELPARWRVHEPCRVVIADFLARYRLPVQSVIYTSHQAKAETLVRRGIELHYDDDPNEVAMAADTGVQVVLLNGVTLHA